jgi:hypothetical protein
MNKWTPEEKEAFARLHPEHGPKEALDARNKAIQTILNWKNNGKPRMNDAERQAYNSLNPKGAKLDGSYDYNTMIKKDRTADGDEKFKMFIEDLAKRDDIGENRLNQILGNPEVLKSIRAIYGFKEGGKFIPKGKDGSWWDRIKSFFINEKLAEEGKARAQAQTRTPVSTTGTTNSGTGTGGGVRGDNTKVVTKKNTTSQANSGKDTRSQAEADKPTTPATPVNPVT